jgi:hypothetical protein
MTNIALLLDAFNPDILPAHIPQEIRNGLDKVDSTQFANFIRSIYPELKNSPLTNTLLNDFFTLIVKSEHPAVNWVDSICEVYAWLQDKKKKAYFKDVCGYVSCYIESKDSESIKKFLDTYGFQNSF